MRRLSLTAFLAVPLLVLAAPASANPNTHTGPIPFPCGLGATRNGACLGFFPGIHQHGPLFNYGPYYGYYPFKPYGPWDAYLRYDPFFYGDPYAADWAKLYGPQPENKRAETGNYYGKNPHFQKHGGRAAGGCGSSGFLHASWLNGGWFRGHDWLPGGFGWHHPRTECKSCGGVAVVESPAPAGPNTRFTGIGTPAQSTVYYAGLPSLDPVHDVLPAGARE